jgi:hypothetical protein
VPRRKRAGVPLQFVPGGWRRVATCCLVDPVEDLRVGECAGGHEEPYGVVADEARKGDQPLQQ